MVAVWLVGMAAHAFDCADPVSRPELDAAVDEVQTAWTNVDDTAFRDGLNTLAGVLLPCMGDAVTPETAARVHLLMGLHLFANGDEENAFASARAARASDPDFVPGPELVPAEHPLHAVWDAAPEPPRPRKVPEPKAGAVAFDGVQSRLRDPERASIVQVFDDTGFARTTTYLGVGEVMPIYPAVPRRRNTLLGCAIGAGTLGGAAYVGAWSARGDVYGLAASPDPQRSALESSRTTTNVLSVLSTTLIGTAAGCGTGAALVGQR
jgi:hypothetical protein